MSGAPQTVFPGFTSFNPSKIHALESDWNGDSPTFDLTTDNATVTPITSIGRLATISGPTRVSGAVGAAGTVGIIYNVEMSFDVQPPGGTIINVELSIRTHPVRSA
ncbi:hypothetical protein Msil_1280 [Methylocella silvestris BL2]|uniref:Uncharacterized protein n=1 Tax=Methylocella silvestris (strain DSM 15510 / CIP 108128 / LMG 27833 / NCIMB 13906 / BL2) TaxID=395965 RepID=B8ER65_METSB|nr:hypothetical protein Msil_1280 [Methylocella silvestris BL2]